MPRVILIDDSQLARRLCGNHLRVAGYEVLEAADGEAGLKCLHTQGADCVVTDMLMPGISGFDVLRRIRIEMPGIPVLVMTADIQESTRTQCEQLGAAAFLNKPVQAEVLVSAVERALGRHTEMVT